LNFLLREFIAQLPPMEELCLDVQDAASILPAIVRHGKTLRKLEFGGAIPGPKTKRSMIVKDIETIQKLLPELVRLELDLDVPEELVRPLLLPLFSFQLLEIDTEASWTPNSKWTYSPSSHPSPICAPCK
jgi:hypothetical protein